MGPSVAYIYHKNFIHNIGLIREAIGNKKIMAVVKANAYGHGSVEMAKSAINSRCEYLGVAFVEEGIELREAGIKAPILVFGAHDPDVLKTAIEYELEVTLTSKNQIQYLKNAPGKIPVHLKVDTGMHRVGFDPENFEDALKMLVDSPIFELKGIYSHFATSDENDDSYAQLQLQRFNDVKDTSNRIVQHEVLFHMANSGAIMKYPQANFDMVRPGVMLYGGKPNPDFPLKWDLKQVMELRSKIGLIKKLPAGEPVSYGRRYFTKNETHIAVIPLGYADGYSRKLTNKGEVIINNNKYPVVGTVCMDMIMADLNNHSDCNVGDDIILFGESGNLRISIDDVAKITGTIAYEVTCNISKRIPRIHIYN